MNEKTEMTTRESTQSQDSGNKAYALIYCFRISSHKARIFMRPWQEVAERWQRGRQTAQRLEDCLRR